MPCRSKESAWPLDFQAGDQLESVRQCWNLWIVWMLAEERHRRIIEYVERDGSARVRDLAELLNVTDETIRRDLEKLEKSNRILRRHGGALPINPTPWDKSFAQREVMNPQEKEAIARHALRHVEKGDIIFLDASTTSLNIARLLPDEEYVVLSYSFQVLLELISKENVRVIAIGGTLDRGTRSFVGPSAEHVLGTYHVTKAFSSCTAFHDERGATDSNEFHASLKTVMMKNARERFLLADHSKYGGTSLSFFAHLEEFDTLISDAKLETSAVSALEGHGLKVELAHV